MTLTPEQNEAFAYLLMGFVALVGAFAWLPKPRWLDRLWVWAIGAAFFVWVPLGLIITIQDGWAIWSFGPVFMLVVFLVGLIDGLRSRDSAGTAVRPPPPPRPPDSPAHGRTSA